MKTNKYEDYYCEWCKPDSTNRIIEEMSDAYLNLNKNKYGDIYSESDYAPEYIANPFNGEKVPVYSQEEADILEEIYQITDKQYELEEWLTKERDGEERANIRKELNNLDEDLLALETKLEKMSKEKKEHLKAKREEKRAKIKAEKIKTDKEKKRIAKEAEERQEILDAIPDSLKEHMKRLF